MRDFVDPTAAHLPPCPDETSAVKTFNTLMSSLSQIAFPYSKAGCLIPCSQVSYDYNLEYYSSKSRYYPGQPDKYTSETILLHFQYRRDYSVRCNGLAA